jgi:hypothetical protein
MINQIVRFSIGYDKILLGEILLADQPFDYVMLCIFSLN